MEWASEYSVGVYPALARAVTKDVTTILSFFCRLIIVFGRDIKIENRPTSRPLTF